MLTILWNSLTLNYNSWMTSECVHKFVHQLARWSGTCTNNAKSFNVYCFKTKPAPLKSFNVYCFTTKPAPLKTARQFQRHKNCKIESTWFTIECIKSTHFIDWQISYNINAKVNPLNGFPFNGFPFKGSWKLYRLKLINKLQTGPDPNTTLRLTAECK